MKASGRKRVRLASWIVLVMSAYVCALYLLLGLGQFAAPSAAALTALHLDPWWAELLRGVPQFAVSLLAFRLVRLNERQVMVGGLLLGLLVVYHLISSLIRLAQFRHLPTEAIVSAGAVVLLACAAAIALLGAARERSDGAIAIDEDASMAGG